MLVGPKGEKTAPVGPRFFRLLTSWDPVFFFQLQLYNYVFVKLFNFPYLI